MADYILRDGVKIPLPDPNERTQFAQWVRQNSINDAFHPNQHYDYVSAFRSAINRDAASAHFPDTYKLPGHKTFSNESQYAAGPLAQYAGSWPENAKSDADFIPPAARYKPDDSAFAQAVLSLFSAVAGAKK